MMPYCEKCKEPIQIVPESRKITPDSDYIVPPFLECGCKAEIKEPDIVERLRQPDEDYMSGKARKSEVMEIAAKEMERLRVEVRLLKEQLIKAQAVANNKDYSMEFQPWRSGCSY